MAAIKDLSSEALQQLTNGVCKGERWAVEYVLNKVLPVGRIVESDAKTPQELLVEFQDGNFAIDEMSKIASVFKNISDAEIDQLREKFDEVLNQLAIDHE